MARPCGCRLPGSAAQGAQFSRRFPLFRISANLRLRIPSAFPRPSSPIPSAKSSLASLRPGGDHCGEFFNQKMGNTGVVARGERRVVMGGMGTSVGPLGVVDEGLTVAIRLGEMRFRVSKSEVAKYLWPAMGLAVAGLLGALFIGPFVLAFLILAGAVLTSLSVVGAFMAAIFVMPVSIMFGLAALTTLGGLAFAAAATGLTVLAWFAMVSLAQNMELGRVTMKRGARASASTPGSDSLEEDEDWIMEIEERDREIAQELRDFDDRLSSTWRDRQL
ncbi:unnamed protein product [Ostreobium quekettii]|uniref:Oleosin n=1 Tax=Ostreobium quekettii TaxID=121088 RepID=A0A8S1JIT2_9CHLO|nr:unnamed protein product [Ostreobium quekettii]|eukprot:evm.model.scf_962.5 EVM.evm.TU.scf_962.5   scf_962:45358-51561(-)